MSFSFNILWFDDQFKDLKRQVRQVKTFLVNQGFEPNIIQIDNIRQETLDEIKLSVSSHNYYDFVLFDYKFMGADSTGIISSKQIRDVMFTDIIFYSSSSEDVLSKEIYENNIEGAYVASRISDFVPKIQRILEDYIKRTTKINNLRGLILSEISEIENILRNKFSQYINEKCTEEQRNGLPKRIIKRLSEDVKKVTSYSHSMLLTDYRIFTANHTRSYFDKFLRENGTQIDLLSEKGLLKELQDLRNDFGHKKSVYNQETGTITLDGLDKVYDYNEFTTVRKKLLELRNIVNSELLPY